MKERLLRILADELVPALGCTEPMAIAFSAAKAAEMLGKMPDKLEVEACANIIKNVKGVALPGADGRKGIDYAAVLGALIGKSEKKLEIFDSLTSDMLIEADGLIAKGVCTIDLLKGDSNLRAIVRAFSDKDVAEVEIKDGHCHIVRLSLNGDDVYVADAKENEFVKADFSLKDIYDFVCTVPFADIEEIIDRQIKCNLAICDEGLRVNSGKNVGKTLINNYPDGVSTKAKARAAAGSEARMNGCPLPVVINSGSGNQGITVSVPIYVFAEEYGSSRESLIRSVALSNLVAIYLKRGIGKLSAYCGVVSVGCGVAAGLTYLAGGTYDRIMQAISNTVADVSGIICDGAKSSCAAKIASSVDAAIMCHYMAMSGESFDGGDGIINWDIERTVENVIRIGRDGMKETDEEIINIMLNK